MFKLDLNLLNTTFIYHNYSHRDGEMDFKWGTMKHWKVFSATMVDRQEKILNLDTLEWLKQ